MGKLVPMMWRPQLKQRPWWDTDFSRRWTVTGGLARMWGQLFAPIPHEIPANDRDHLPW